MTYHTRRRKGKGQGTEVLAGRALASCPFVYGTSQRQTPNKSCDPLRSFMENEGGLRLAAELAADHVASIFSASLTCDALRLGTYPS
jgi:hypothetical protein